MATAVDEMRGFALDDNWVVHGHVHNIPHYADRLVAVRGDLAGTFDERPGVGSIGDGVLVKTLGFLGDQVGEIDRDAVRDGLGAAVGKDHLVVAKK